MKKMNTPMRVRPSPSRFGALFVQGIHFLYIRLIEPRSNSDDSRRREFILNIILLGTITLLIWSDLHILFSNLTRSEVFDAGEAISFSAFTLIVAACFSLYALSRAGKYEIASYLLIVLYIGGVSYGMYRWGFDLPAGLLSLGLIIVTSSILISSRFGFLIASLIVLTLFFLGLISNQTMEVSPWKTEVVTATDAVQYSIILLIIATISWISNREIEKSLERAHESEKALKEERDLLEIKVEERTKGLKQAQIEKMSQLYRFAEFGRLSSGLFHDLINPLTAVALNTYKLEHSSLPEAPEIASYVKKAVAASKRMESFIETVRKHINPEGVHELFSINAEIEQSIELLSYKARQEKVSLVFIPHGMIKTFGNAVKFHQMVTNLISNAIDSYATTDRTVQSHCAVHIELWEENGRIHMQVSDRGCGIPADIVERIFDPFFTTKQAYHGTGLGLSTTKTIVEKEFLGKIQVKSAPQKGSTFTVVFPRTSNGRNHQHYSEPASNDSAKSSIERVV